MFPWAVSPRWPDAIGLRIKAGPVTGGGYLERKVRTYGTGADAVRSSSSAACIQLEILKVGVYAIGILSPEPFSLVLVMGVRFPTPIELTLRLHVQRRRRHPRPQPPGRHRRSCARGCRTHFIDQRPLPRRPGRRGAEDPRPGRARSSRPTTAASSSARSSSSAGGRRPRSSRPSSASSSSLPDPKIILLGAIRIRAPAKADAAHRLPRARSTARSTPTGCSSSPRCSDSKIADDRRVGRPRPAHPVGRRRRLRAVGRRLPPEATRRSRPRSRASTGSRSTCRRRRSSRSSSRRTSPSPPAR